MIDVMSSMGSFDATLAFSLPMVDLPSFDWKAALIVGAIVVVAVVAVVVLAVALPGIALAGATMSGTGAAVAGIALIIGAVAGTAAGFVKGHRNDLEVREKRASIRAVSNQFDIYFKPSERDPESAADFTCTLVTYDEADMDTRQPSIILRKSEISAYGPEEFYAEVERQFKQCLRRSVSADEEGIARKVRIFMDPYPGEGVYDRLVRMMEKNGRRDIQVVRIEGEWESALEDPD